jgi:hypothetical protein
MIAKSYHSPARERESKCTSRCAGRVILAWIGQPPPVAGSIQTWTLLFTVFSNAMGLPSGDQELPSTGNA